MAEFLKAKTTTLVNKPLGIVSTRTGAPEAFEALASAGQRAQQMFYEEAVVNQKQAGKDYVNNLKVQARNEKGEFIYAELDPSLSKVATREAQPLLRAKMSNALLVDASTRLNKLRAESTDAKMFETKANAYIEESIKQLDATGGGEYSSVYQQLATKTMAQHMNHMVLADAKKAQLIDTQNALFAIDTGINELATSITEGVNIFGDENDEFDTSQMIDNLKGQASMLLENGEIQEPKYRDLINRIEKTTMDASINNKIAPMSNNLDLNGLFIIETAVRTGKVKPEDMKYLQTYDIDQEDIDNIRTIRSNRDYHASKIANVRSIVSQRTALQNKSNTDLRFAQRLDSGFIATLKPKEQILYDNVLGKKYRAEWVLQNWDKGDFLNDSLKSSRLPYSVEEIFNNLEMIDRMNSINPDLAKANMISAVKLFSNIMYTQDTSGNKTYEYGLSSENQSKWMRLKRLTDQFGDDAIMDLTQKIFLTREDENVKSSIRQTNIQAYSGYKTDAPKSASAFMTDWLRTYTQGKDMSHEATEYLKPIAMHHLAIANTNESTLKQILDDTYNTMYQKSSYIYNIGQGSGMVSSLPGGMKFKTLASRFAPEKYFREQKHMDVFLNDVNKKLVMATTGKFTIGKNAFLLPSRRSTNTAAEYMVVDESGTPIINKQTNNIFQVSTKVVDSQLLMERRKQQEDRWDRARSRRRAIIQSKQTAKEDLSGSTFEVIGNIWSKLGF
jgi:hypothetical protein